VGALIVSGYYSAME